MPQEEKLLPGIRIVKTKPCDLRTLRPVRLLLAQYIRENSASTKSGECLPSKSGFLPRSQQAQFLGADRKLAPTICRLTNLSQPLDRKSQAQAPLHPPSPAGDTSAAREGRTPKKTRAAPANSLPTAIPVTFPLQSALRSSTLPATAGRREPGTVATASRSS